MTNKIWDGATWKEYKNLRVWNGSAWKDAAKGWLWDGTAWKQFYPEYPVNTTAPTISGNAIQGNQLTVTDGTWKGFPSDKAFAYTSTAYQWLRNGSNISGATGNQYATTVSDVGTAVSCRVTVSNGRGPTPSTTSNSITVQQALPGSPSNLSVTSSTVTPGSFSVSSSSTATTSPSISTITNSSVTSNSGQINWTSSNQSSWSSTGTFSGSGTSETSVSKSGLSASTTYTGSVTVRGPAATNATGSWTQPTNVSYYTYSTNTGSLSANESTRTFTLTVGSGSGGAYYEVYVAAWNTNGSAFISWTAGSNATSYDIYINGVYWTNTSGTSITYNWGQTGNLTVNVRSRNAQGVESTGVSATGAVNAATRQPSTNGYIASGNTASANYSLTTSSSEIIPTINSFTKSTSDTAQSLISTQWSATNQNTWSISVSPATGGASGGSSFSGTSQTSKYIGQGSPGTTYSITLTITSTTSNTAQSTIYHTVPSGSSTPSTPGTPTLTYVSANNTSTTWGYSASWGASSGSGTIEYQVDCLGVSGGSGTLGLYSSTSASFNLSKNDNTWQIRVRATNNGGSTWSSYSAYSNSA